jgi:hypothetical protein
VADRENDAIDRYSSSIGSGYRGPGPVGFHAMNFSYDLRESIRPPCRCLVQQVFQILSIYRSADERGRSDRSIERLSEANEMRGVIGKRGHTPCGDIQEVSR